MIPLLNGNVSFTDVSGGEHYIDGRWDLIIGFPPCTYLTNASAVRMRTNGVLNLERYKKAMEAREFFLSILNADCDHICIENPVPLKIVNLPPYNQIIQPWQFGHPWTKRTCLWLKNLPPLMPTEIVSIEGYWIGAHGHEKAKNGMSQGFRDPKKRSKTFEGIAKAMATQFTDFVLNNRNNK